LERSRFAGSAADSGYALCRVHRGTQGAAPPGASALGAGGIVRPRRRIRGTSARLRGPRLSARFDSGQRIGGRDPLVMGRARFPMSPIILMAPLLAAALLSAWVGGNGPWAASVVRAPPQNTLAVTVDAGPPAAPGGAPIGAINHAYVTVKVCVPGSQTECASVDHVLLDTGSWGLRLVRSVLTAHAVTLSPEVDAQGRTIEECVHFGGGDTWGPVALADVTMAGESAAKLPVQVLDDRTVPSPAPPATCGANGTLINGVSGFDANGVLGLGVFAQDCGAACLSSAMSIYYGCTAAGVCTAEIVALANQVTNPVTMFATDNNGIIVNLPNLKNANGDATVQGELIFGIATQTNNGLPA